MFLKSPGFWDGVTIEAKVRDEILDSLWLDGIRIDVKSAQLNGSKVDYKIFDQGIALFPESTLMKDDLLEIKVSYEAEPKRGMFFIGWDDPSGRARKQIWTQGQGVDHRLLATAY